MQGKTFCNMILKIISSKTSEKLMNFWDELGNWEASFNLLFYFQYESALQKNFFCNQKIYINDDWCTYVVVKLNI